MTFPAAFLTQFTQDSESLQKDQKSPQVFVPQSSAEIQGIEFTATIVLVSPSDCEWQVEIMEILTPEETMRNHRLRSQTDCPKF